MSNTRVIVRSKSTGDIDKLAKDETQLLRNMFFAVKKNALINKNALVDNLPSASSSSSSAQKQELMEVRNELKAPPSSPIPIPVAAAAANVSSSSPPIAHSIPVYREADRAYYMGAPGYCMI